MEKLCELQVLLQYKVLFGVDPSPLLLAAGPASEETDQLGELYALSLVKYPQLRCHLEI